MRRAQNRSWTAQEDDALRACMVVCPGSWTRLAELMKEAFPSVQPRSGKQCRERWINNLDPNVVTAPWTTTEDETILRFVAQNGSRWKTLERLFVGRTDTALKNRFNSLRRKAERRAVRSLEPREPDMSNAPINPIASRVSIDKTRCLFAQSDTAAFAVPLSSRPVVEAIAVHSKPPDYAVRVPQEQQHQSGTATIVREEAVEVVNVRGAHDQENMAACHTPCHVRCSPRPILSHNGMANLCASPLASKGQTPRQSPRVPTPHLPLTISHLTPPSRHSPLV